MLKHEFRAFSFIKKGTNSFHDARMQRDVVFHADFILFGRHVPHRLVVF